MDEIISIDALKKDAVDAGKTLLESCRYPATSAAGYVFTERYTELMHEKLTDALKVRSEKQNSPQVA